MKISKYEKKTSHEEHYENSSNALSFCKGPGIPDSRFVFEL